MLTDQCKRPLLLPKRGAFLYPDLGPFAVAPEGREDGHVGIDTQRVIAPVTCGDHTAIEIEDPA